MNCEPQPHAGAAGNSAAGRLATLTTRADFLRIAASRRKAVTPGLILQAARSPGSEACAVRVGFTASRKVGNAVVRNRAKRRLRAVAARVLSDMGRPGTDYVLIARAATAERPFAALLDDLEAALRRVAPGVARTGTHAAQRDQRGGQKK